MERDLVPIELPALQIARQPKNIKDHFEFYMLKYVFFPKVNFNVVIKLGYPKISHSAFIRRRPDFPESCTFSAFGPLCISRNFYSMYPPGI